MTDETIVAVYENSAHADAAVAGLIAAGVPESAISKHTEPAPASRVATGGPVREQGFWSNLFGGEPDHDVAVYDRSLESGAVVVSVRPSEAHIADVLKVLEAHQPIDVDERASAYGLTHQPSDVAERSGLATSATSAVATPVRDGGETLNLSEESLSVGKRLVNRGGTRIRRFVVETPVEEAVTLHSERVTIDRRPVADGRLAEQPDFTEKTIEVTESDEEAVVSKEARVYEEVVLRKEATDRVETVRDTVRREEVEVENVPAGNNAVPSRAKVDPRSPKN